MIVLKPPRKPKECNSNKEKLTQYKIGWLKRKLEPNTMYLPTINTILGPTTIRPLEFLLKESLTVKLQVQDK